MGNYIGLIHKDADSHFGVSFPDFPGVITAGTTLDDARAMAEEALAFHIEGMMEDGEAIPEPSALEEVMSDPDNRSGVAVLISVKNVQPKAVRVNVTFARRCPRADRQIRGSPRLHAIGTSHAGRQEIDGRSGLARSLNVLASPCTFRYLRTRQRGIIWSSAFPR
jgi:predicted RNase H-like HicB family nuclease